MREDWIEVELGDLVNNPKTDIVDGPFGSSLKSNEYVKTGIPVLKIQNIKANRFVDKNINFVTLEKAEILKRHSFQSGDLIITKLGNPLGLCCEVPLKYYYGIIVADLLRFRPNGDIVIKSYLKNCINSILIQKQFKEITKGTTRPRVNLSIVRCLKFNLPPLPIQRAIVSKIEALFSDLDNGIANFKKAQAQLKIYRQAVLKKAFEGELTKAWREKQSKLPTAEELLKQIKEERQNHYNQQVEDWKKAVEEWEEGGKVGKKQTKPAVYKIYNSPVKNLDLKIPNNWIFSCIGNVCSKTEYGSSAKSLDNGDVPVIRMGNMQNGKIDWEDLKYSSNIDEINQYLLKKDDILFNRTNSPELVGKTVQYKGERPAIFAGYLIRLNHIHTIIISSYLNYFLNSHPAKSYGSLVKTDGVNQSNINGEKLSNYPIPICSLLEQAQIVQEIEFRLSVCDKMEQSITESIAKAEALRQSILKKAFEGKLLSQAEIDLCKKEADYEPAGELLKKIKAEKLTKEQAKKQPGIKNKTQK